MVNLKKMENIKLKKVKFKFLIIKKSYKYNKYLYK